MHKKLSETEMLIMTELWAIGKPISVKELAEWLLIRKKIDWKVQTISTFLVRMEQKGYIHDRKSGKAKLYYPAFSSEEIQSIEAKGLLENHYDGSFKKFLVALSSGKISDEEADKLERWLIEQKEEKIE
ncbi:MAG: BlaI/MecI/CopY family transcriptional regulator [Hungatella sp.]